jgi:hypothetical protein
MALKKGRGRVRNDRGVIYVATGAAHIEAARASAASVRRTNPDLGIAIFCDDRHPGGEFDRVVEIPDGHARSKVDYLPRTPFCETLYLDTDTRVAGDLTEAFRLLERFDIAVAQRVPDPGRLRRDQGADKPPVAFPEHNAGVIFYGSSTRVAAFFENWKAAYHERGRKADQVTFRERLWASDVRLTVLPARYNTRKYTWVDHWLKRGADPVILHTNRYHPDKQGGGLLRVLRRLSGPGV